MTPTRSVTSSRRPEEGLDPWQSQPNNLPIEEYALIGDCHSAALVSSGGSIDWLCLPRFDSSACFAAMVGTPENGHFAIAPSVSYSVSRRYRQDTLVLETTFTTAEGVVRLSDAMTPRQDHKNPHLVRVIECLSGEVPMELSLLAAFDYGSVQPRVAGDGRFAVITAGPDSLQLWSGQELTVRGTHVGAEFTLRSGAVTSFGLTWFPSHEAAPFPVAGQAALDGTADFWTKWVRQCTYMGPYREAVVRSLITLKALTYAPTGGMVAAPTMSLPENLGGTRNWDYRYCWVRDTALSLSAFMRCGFVEEATAWWEWLSRSTAGDPGQLQVLYSITGKRRIEERELSWLAGYAGSVPVRCGNAAYAHVQNDLYGELVDAFYQYRNHNLSPPRDTWEQEVALVEFVERQWRHKDRSIWEVRDRSRHFTFSKMMSWVAFDRAIKDADQFGLPGPVDKWKKLRAIVKDEVLAKAYDTERNRFTMAYDLEGLDAALLLMPVMGFLPATDPRMLGTIDAIAEELDFGGLTRRYIPGAPGPKDLEMGTEGVFLPTSFWLVDAQAMSGQVDRATERYERLIGLSNDVGLLAEEYDPDAGLLLGNFPQAFSHQSLIDSACRLADAEGASPGGSLAY